MRGCGRRDRGVGGGRDEDQGAGEEEGKEESNERESKGTKTGSGHPLLPRIAYYSRSKLSTADAIALSSNRKRLICEFFAAKVSSC